MIHNKHQKIYDRMKDLHSTLKAGKKTQEATGQREIGEEANGCPGKTAWRGSVASGGNVWRIITRQTTNRVQKKHFSCFALKYWPKIGKKSENHCHGMASRHLWQWITMTSTHSLQIITTELADWEQRGESRQTRGLLSPLCSLFLFSLPILLRPVLFPSVSPSAWEK